MTAWDELIRRSTLGAGTAWDHITHQAEGTGGDTVVLVATASASLSALGMEANMDDGVTVAVVASAVLGSNVSEAVLEGTVTAMDMDGAVQSTGLAASVMEDVL